MGTLDGIIGTVLVLGGVLIIGVGYILFVPRKKPGMPMMMDMGMMPDMGMPPGMVGTPSGGGGMMMQPMHMPPSMLPAPMGSKTMCPTGYHLTCTSPRGAHTGGRPKNVMCSCSRPLPPPSMMPPPMMMPPVMPSPAGMTDSYGVRMLYPTSRANPHIDYTPSNAAARPIFIGPSNNSQSTRIDFDSGPQFINQEVTGYFLLTHINPNKIRGWVGEQKPWTDINIKFRGGIHTSGPLQYDGCCEILGVWPGNDAVGHAWRKECPHPNYRQCSGVPYRFSLPPLWNRWVGIKGVIWTTPSGTVRLQSYVDLGDNTSRPSNNWVLLADVEDRGQCFEQPYLRTRGNSHKTTFRLENMDVQAKWLSCREIV